MEKHPLQKSGEERVSINLQWKSISAIEEGTELRHYVLHDLAEERGCMQSVHFHFKSAKRSLFLSHLDGALDPGCFAIFPSSLPSQEGNLPLQLQAQYQVLSHKNANLCTPKKLFTEKRNH